MLNVHKISSAAGARQYQSEAHEINEQTASNYYSDKDKIAGEWHGSLAEMVGLKGEVDFDQFEELLKGKAGDFQKFAYDKPGAKNLPGWDLTFVVPKSLSIISEVYGDDRIHGAVMNTVKTVLSHLETDLVGTRIRTKLGINYEKTGNTAAALFLHKTARPVTVDGVKHVDPLLHVHAVLANMTINSAGKASAIHGNIPYKELRSMFNDELAKEVRQLGYDVDIYKDKNNEVDFKLERVSEKAEKQFSKRSKVVKEYINEHGDTRFINKIAGAATRENKDGNIDLMTQWHNQMHMLGEDYSAVVAQARTADIEHSIPPGAADVLAAFHEITETDPTVSLDKLVNAIKAKNPGRSGIADIQSTINHLRGAGKIVEVNVDVARRGFGRHFTTAAIIKQRDELRSLTTAGVGMYAALADSASAESFVSKVEAAGDFAWHGTQRDALTNTLSNNDFVTVIEGWAGTGKTTTVLSGLNQFAQQAGLKIEGLAPMAVAASNLESEAGIKSSTVALFITKYEKEIQRLSTLRDQISRSHTDEAEYRDLQSKHENKLLVMDEAGTANASDMLKVLKMAKDSRSKIVLVGDRSQIEAIDGRNAFATIAESATSYTALTNIMRQKNETLRSAVQSIYRYSIEGKAAALHDFFDKVHVTETQNAESYSTSKAADLVAAAMEHVNDEINSGRTPGKDVLVIALDNNTRTQLNREIQSSRLERGELNKADGRSFKTSDGELKLYKNDQIVFTNNNRKADYLNAETGTIKSFGDNFFEIQKQNGSTVKVSAKDHHFTLGYAITTHKSQGQTVDSVIAVVDSNSKLAKINTLLVGATRSRHDYKLVTDNVENLKSKIIDNEQRPTIARAALEVVLSDKNQTVFDKVSLYENQKETTNKDNKHEEPVKAIDKKSDIKAVDSIVHANIKSSIDKALKFGNGITTVAKITHSVESSTKETLGRSADLQLSKNITIIDKPADQSVGDHTHNTDVSKAKETDTKISIVPGKNETLDRNNDVKPDRNTSISDKSATHSEGNHSQNASKEHAKDTDTKVDIASNKNQTPYQKDDVRPDRNTTISDKPAVHIEGSHSQNSEHKQAKEIDSSKPEQLQKAINELKSNAEKGIQDQHYKFVNGENLSHDHVQKISDSVKGTNAKVEISYDKSKTTLDHPLNQEYRKAFAEKISREVRNHDRAGGEYFRIGEHEQRSGDDRSKAIDKQIIVDKAKVERTIRLKDDVQRGKNDRHVGRQVGKDASSYAPKAKENSVKEVLKTEDRINVRDMSGDKQERFHAEAQHFNNTHKSNIKVLDAADSKQLWKDIHALQKDTDASLKGDINASQRVGLNAGIAVKNADKLNDQAVERLNGLSEATGKAVHYLADSDKLNTDHAVSQMAEKSKPIKINDEKKEAFYDKDLNAARDAKTPKNADEAEQVKEAYKTGMRDRAIEKAAEHVSAHISSEGHEKPVFITSSKDLHNEMSKTFKGEAHVYHTDNDIPAEHKNQHAVAITASPSTGLSDSSANSEKLLATASKHNMTVIGPEKGLESAIKNANLKHDAYQAINKISDEQLSEKGVQRDYGNAIRSNSRTKIEQNSEKYVAGGAGQDHNKKPIETLAASALGDRLKAPELRQLHQKQEQISRMSGVKKASQSAKMIGEGVAGLGLGAAGAAAKSVAQMASGRLPTAVFKGNHFHAGYNTLKAGVKAALTNQLRVDQTKIAASRALSGASQKELKLAWDSGNKGNFTPTLKARGEAQKSVAVKEGVKQAMIKDINEGKFNSPATLALHRAKLHIASKTKGYAGAVAKEYIKVANNEKAMVAMKNAARTARLNTDVPAEQLNKKIDQTLKNQQRLQTPRLKKADEKLGKMVQSAIKDPVNAHRAEQFLTKELSASKESLVQSAKNVIKNVDTRFNNEQLKQSAANYAATTKALGSLQEHIKNDTHWSAKLEASKQHNSENERSKISFEKEIIDNSKADPKLMAARDIEYQKRINSANSTIKDQEKQENPHIKNDVLKSAYAEKMKASELREHVRSTPGHQEAVKNGELSKLQRTQDKQQEQSISKGVSVAR